MDLPGYPVLKEKWVNSFLAVSKTLDLALASEQLKLTPRTLNRNLQALEKALGTSLLLRQPGNKVLLVSDGLVLLEELQTLESQLNTLFFNAGLKTHQQVPEPKTYAEPQQLLLACCSPWPMMILPPLLDQLEAAGQRFYPRVRQLAWAEQVESAVLAGQAELGLSCRQPVSDALCWQQAAEIPYLIVSALQPKRGWQDWAYITGFGHQPGSLHGPWNEEQFPRQVVMRSESLSAVLDLLTSGLCAAWLPECLVDEMIQEREFAEVADPPEPRFLTPYLIWRRDTDLSDLTQELMNGLMLKLKAAEPAQAKDQLDQVQS